MDRPAEIWIWEEQQGAYPIRDKILRRLVLSGPPPPPLPLLALDEPFCFDCRILPAQRVQSPRREDRAVNVGHCLHFSRGRFLFPPPLFFFKAVCLFIVEGSRTKPTPGPVL